MIDVSNPHAPQKTTSPILRQNTTVDPEQRPGCTGGTRVEGTRSRGGVIEVDRYAITLQCAQTT
jgi:hypothetical protein